MLSCQKDHFNLPEELHYLNCAYMAPRADCVEEAGMNAIRRDRVPTQITPELFFSESQLLRERFAHMINAPSDRIAILPSVSYGVATVAKNLSLRRGQNIVLMHEQFPSNVYGWQRMAETAGCEIRTQHAPEARTERGMRWNERILDSIDRNTGLVALGHVHWADGTRFDLEAIGARARDVGAALVVDGTQSVGALPFDVARFKPDALICAGYKWLLGPYSLGVAYYGPRFSEGIPLEESWITRFNSEDFAGLVEYEDRYQPGAVRFDMGERSNFVLAPMLLAALDQLMAWGIDEIQDYCARLTEGLIRDATQMGYVIEDPAWRAAHMFGIRPPGHVSIDTLKRCLADRNVVVSVRGDAVRVSPHVYNDAADTGALLGALESCLHARVPTHEGS